MQTKRFALGKFVTLIIFAVCLMSLSAGIVFAYVPTLKFESSVSQTLSNVSLTHIIGDVDNDDNEEEKDIVLFDTSKTITVPGYTVKPINSDTVQVKCEYKDLTKDTNNVITFTSNKTATITLVKVYGADITAKTELYTKVSGQTCTIKFNTNGTTFVVANDDEVVINFQFS